MAATIEHRLHPEARAVLQYFLQAGAKPYFEYESVQAARDYSSKISKPVYGTCEEYTGTVDDMRIPSGHVPGQIPKC